ncbi:MAG TPA: ABC transporter substrate-binding protein, partial [candidate division Zixibacteria bacterium]|nr:ABC transporter substrate-binding protein [candidate division Zixibacteria bacterium]
GENRRALDICRRALEIRGTGEFTDSLKALEGSLTGRISERLTILVLAPTEGLYSEYGTNIANGVQLAVDNYNKGKRKNIQVVVENTVADPLVAALACQSAIRRHAPIAVIGPLMSNVAVPVAIVCDHERVPLIMPTSSKDGLSALSPFAFQVSPPPSIGAKTLAEYAIDSLGILQFSALAPDDPTGRKAVEQFVRTVESRDGEMVSVAYYSEGTIDFSDQLRKIRQPYFEEAKRFVARADSSDFRFFTPEGKSRDEGEWIMEIPGFFIPAYYEDLVNVIPQVPFNYMRARYLGENGWMIDRIRTMSGAHIDSAIVVPDDFWVDEGSSNWTDFSRDYRRSFGGSPSRIAALAYDSARLVLHGIDRGLITPDQQRDYLSAVYKFTGPSGSITFDEMGTNVDVQLVRFVGNRPEKIE